MQGLHNHDNGEYISALNVSTFKTMLIIFIGTYTCFKTPFVHTLGFMKSDHVSIEQCFCHYIAIYIRSM